MKKEELKDAEEKQRDVEEIAREVRKEANREAEESVDAAEEVAKNTADEKRKAVKKVEDAIDRSKEKIKEYPQNSRNHGRLSLGPQSHMSGRCAFITLGATVAVSPASPPALSLFLVAIVMSLSEDLHAA